MLPIAVLGIESNPLPTFLIRWHSRWHMLDAVNQATRHQIYYPSDVTTRWGIYRDVLSSTARSLLPCQLMRLVIGLRWIYSGGFVMHSVGLNVDV